VSPLTVHVLPEIGTLPIEDIDQHTLRALFEPIWHSKPDAARKAMNRLNLALLHAVALGREVDVQAVPKAKALLGKQRHQEQHIPSLPYTEAPAFYKLLCAEDTASARALRFLMLTVSRSGEVRFATHGEIMDDLWVIPAERTKTNQEHRVPLTDAAQDAFDGRLSQSAGDYLFPNNRGSALSDAAMAKFMKDRGFAARPHGMRSTFRSWAEECTDAAFEIKEACLGHKVDHGVVGAYQRSDRLETRRELLEHWSAFLLDGCAST